MSDSPSDRMAELRRRIAFLESQITTLREQLAINTRTVAYWHTRCEQLEGALREHGIPF